MKNKTVITPFLPFLIAITLSLAACGGGSGSNEKAPGTKTADLPVPGVPVMANVLAGGAGEVKLSWLANQSNVLVSIYEIYRDGAKVGATNASETSYVDRGLPGGSTHQYQLRACDSQSNCSSLSAIVSAQAGKSNDVTVIGIPDIPKLSASTADSISFMWQPGVNSLDVVGYEIWRNGNRIATVSDTLMFVDVGLSPGTEYTYTVRALSSMGNTSAPSNEVRFSTRSLVGTVDSTAPSIPAALSAIGSTADRISLTWQASTDNLAVVGYEIWRNGTRINTTAATTFVDTGLTAATEYSYTVLAMDAAGNSSAPSSVLRVSTRSLTSTVDSTPPTAPDGLRISQAAVDSVKISWVASTDNVSVARYDLYQNAILVGSIGGGDTSYNYTGLSANTRYQLTVQAIDPTGNKSAMSSILDATTLANPAQTADTIAPSVPAGLSLTQSTPNSITFNWNASSDNVGVISYEVYKDGILSGNSVTPGSIITGLAAGTAYKLSVKAVDAAGNRSALSTVLDVTTQATTPAIDAIAPTTPSGLAVTQSTQNSVIITWAASTDNVGVVRYETFINGSAAGSASSTSFTFEGLAPSTSYNVTVRAVDAVGNRSALSAVLSVTTQAIPTPVDTVAPTTPTALSITQTTQSSVTIGWAASTDNVGVARYEPYINGLPTGTASSTSFTFSGLTPSTAYILTVRAADAAGNRSAFSTALNATTQATIPPADTIAPTVPTALVVSQTTQNSLTIGWTASTDNVGVARYEVFVNGVSAGSASSTSFTASSLTASTAYNFTVRAVDVAGNASALSSALTASTTAAVAVPNTLQVRVQGLSLGGQLALAHAGATTTVNLNGPVTLAHPQSAGLALDLTVSAQPSGQSCAVSELAGSTIPTDGSPVFVRCFSSTVAHVTLPDTLPNDPLEVRFGMRGTAYPGIPYESRPGVLGGIFPYEYRIKSFTLGGAAQSTAGVSLDFRRGTVRFTPAVEGSYVLTLTIKDSGATQKSIDYSFTINTIASGFVFVAPDGVDSAGRGSRAAPYKTLSYAVNNSSSDKVIMLRKGTYVTGGISLLDSKAKQIIAYPDEVVVLDMQKTQRLTVSSNSAPAPRIEGIDITHVWQYGIVSDPSSAGLIIRNVRFVDGEEGMVISENPAFIHGYGDNSPVARHKFLIQDNDFGTYTMKSSGAYAITLFDAGQSLTENNQIRVGATTGGIHDKDNSQNNTYRENYVAFDDANRTTRGIQVSAQANSENLHIHHNLLINAGVYLGLQCFDNACYMRNHNVHHNTIAGSFISMNWGPFQPTSYGTRLSNNIIQSGADSPYGGLSCQSRPANITSQLAVAANLITTTRTLAFKDAECTGNDMSWATWQNTYGFDTVVSGSSISATSSLVGSGPLTGLPAGHAQRTLRGHQY